MEDELLDVNIPTNPDSIIKVIGVGGGGGNAVTNMYKEGIHDVSFMLCNTDRQALNGSDVPVKLLLGQTTTCGLGSGDQPERGRKAAEESEEEIRQMHRRQSILQRREQSRSCRYERGDRAPAQTHLYCTKYRLAKRKRDFRRRYQRHSNSDTRKKRRIRFR